MLSSWIRKSDAGGRRKWDRTRWPAPVGAVLAPLTVMALLILLTDATLAPSRAREVEIATADEVQRLEKEPSEAETAEEEPDEVETVGDIAVETPPAPAMDELIPALATEPTFEPVKLPQPESVAMIRAPVAMKTVAGAARGAGGRKAAIAKFGGNSDAEAAVVRALWWIKAQQRTDGSWKAKGEGDATAFALLAFLSHGEDFSSPEFGETVRAAVRHLTRHHGNSMSVYALAEAAAVVKTPVLKEIAATALEEMCAKRRKKVKANSGGLLQRYCAVMAVASARRSAIRFPALEANIADFRDSFTAMRDARSENFARLRGEGTWRYMIAAVCLQYLGAGEEPPTTAMVNRLESVWPPATLGATEIACCPVRSNYFSTMMFFNGGGEAWERWNAGMLSAYVQAQQVERKSVADSRGILHDAGYWRCADRHIGDQPFWPTCYVAHQLMIYYRYLPTYSKESWRGAADVRTAARPCVDVEVEFP